VQTFYESQWSTQVVQDLQRAYPRGWAFLMDHFPGWKERRIAWYLQTRHPYWEICKRCLKLADRLCSTSVEYSDQVIERNVLEMRAQGLARCLKDVHS
jgi:hypothetical protein